MKKLFVLLPSVVLYFLFIVLIDPNFLFSNSDEKIAQSIVDGNNVFVFKKVEPYRNLKKCIIERMPKDTECVVVGPSTSLVFDAKSVGTSSFYNLSITHGSFQDTLAILGILEANDVNYKKLVLSLDNFFFDSKADRYANTEFIKPYADYMSSLVLDGKGDKSKACPDYAELISSKVDALFSVSYFQDSWRYLSSRKLDALTRRWGIVDSKFDGDDFSYDQNAAIFYPKKAVEKTEQDVIDYVSTYDLDAVFSPGCHISSERVQFFDALVSYMKSRGREVELVLVPLPPVMWDKVSVNSDYHVVDEVSEVMEKTKEKYGLVLHGSLNPYKCGVTNADYYDARHVRRDRLHKLFGE